VPFRKKRRRHFLFEGIFRYVSLTRRQIFYLRNLANTEAGERVHVARSSRPSDRACGRLRSSKDWSFCKKTLTFRKINYRPRNGSRARAVLARQHARPRSPEKTARRPRTNCEWRRGVEGGQSSGDGEHIERREEKEAPSENNGQRCRCGG
jgi:hypothetical protein